MKPLKLTRLVAVMGGLCAAVWAFSSTGCQRPSAAAAIPSNGSAEPPSVETVRPERTTIRRFVTLPGQIESYAQTPIYAKITGYVDKFHADLGDEVAKDKLLIELSVPEMVEDLAHKKASEDQATVEIEQVERTRETAVKTLARANATLKLTEAGLARAEASVQRWRAENARMKQLLPTRAVDQSTADATTEQTKAAETAWVEARAAIGVAIAARDESQARCNQAETDVKVAKSKLRVAESDRRHTEEMLKYSRIAAPFAGIVTKRSVDLGHLVQPPTAGTSSTAPLMILERIDMVRVFVEVPEANAAGVSPGVSVQVRVPGLREQEFSGKVVRTSGALDVHGRTLRAQIDLQNPDNRLRPGHFVSARIESVQPGSLTIPATAVFVQNDQPMVVRIEDGKTVRTPVKLGVRQGNKVEVVKKQMKTARSDEGIEWSDFTGEEVLILANPENWANGQTVRPNHGDAQVALAGAVGS